MEHFQSSRPEDEYFYKQDRELLEEGRRQAAVEEVVRDLRAVTGIEDEKILRSLHYLQYDQRTIVLLSILPLVEVAWSDGSVNC